MGAKFLKVNSKSEVARDAFESGDILLSAAIHDQKVSKPVRHKKRKEKIRCFIQGGILGLITSTVIVSGGTGASLDQNIIVLFGLIVFIGIGLVKGLNDFIQIKTELEYIQSEMSREQWEFENYPQGEIAEMIEIYQEKGLSNQDARDLVNNLTKNTSNFIDTMMVEELGIMPPHPKESPFKKSVIGCVSFLLIGGLPLLPFFIGHQINSTQTQLLFGISYVIASISSFILGTFSKKISTYVWWRGGLSILIVICAAGVLAYTAGFIASYGRKI